MNARARVGAPPVLVGHDFVETATWFGPEERPLFGWLTTPRSGRARGAVVLCAPFGEEASMAYRTLRTLAQELAAAGLLALRYSHDGSGDSAGRLNDPDRFAAWSGGLRAAVALARDRSGGADVHVVGLRMGATLAACTQAAGDLGLRSLVLWDPCVTGRAFLRELQMLHAAWLVGRSPIPEGSVETPGYQYTRETAEAVAALRLEPFDAGGAEVLLLERDDRPRPRATGAFVAAMGIEPVPVSEQEGLLNVPTVATVVPRDTVRRIVELVVQRSAPADETAAEVSADTVVRGAGMSRDDDDDGAARWVWDGRDGAAAAIRESACLLDGALVGIVTEPADRPARVAPWFVFVNVAAEAHIGPGRLWAELARDLAVRGMHAIRFDQSNVGDSADRPGEQTDQVYALSWLTDTAKVLQHLPGASGRDAVLVGMCSSAYSALETALRVPVGGVFAVNPFVQAVSNETSDFLLTDVEARLALRPVPAPLSRGTVKHRRGALAAWRAWTTLDLRRSVGSVAWTLARRGVRLVVLVGDEDREPWVREPFWRTVGGVLLRRTGRFRLEDLRQLDHSLRVEEARRDTADRFLAEAEAWARSRPEGADEVGDGAGHDRAKSPSVQAVVEPLDLDDADAGRRS